MGQVGSANLAGKEFLSLVPASCDTAALLHIRVASCNGPPRPGASMDETWARQETLLHYLMRQHGTVDDVADRKDVAGGRGGLEVLVHLDAAPPVQLHAHLLQVQALHIRAPACRVSQG